jgi:hypothetical protein
VEQLVRQMRAGGAPEQAVTQMLSILLEMSTRLLYRSDIEVGESGLRCVTLRGALELPYPGHETA